MRKLLCIAFLLALWPAAKSDAQIATRLQDCNNGTDAATCTLTGVGANHTIVAMMDCYGGCFSVGIPPTTDTFGLTYVLSAAAASSFICDNHIVGPSSDTQFIYYAHTGAHTGSDTVSISTDGAARFVWALEYDQILTDDTWSCGTGSTSPMDSGALVTSVASDLAVTFAYGTGFSAPMTNYALCCGNPGAGFNIGDATLGAAGTYHATITTTANPWILQTLAFKLAAGSSAAPTPRPWIINMRFLFSPRSYVRSRKIPWDDRRRKLEISRA
jgi:hypothetical protein